MKFTVLWDEFVIGLSPPTYFFNFGNIVHFLTPLSETEQLLVFCVNLYFFSTPILGHRDIRGIISKGIGAGILE